MMTQRIRPWIWPSFLLIYGISSTTFAAVEPNQVQPAPKASPVELNYVSPETKASFEKDFETAKAVFVAGTTSELNAKWSCELIAARSGLQHEKNLPLYAFNGPSTDHSFVNGGEAPVKSFLVNDTKTEASGVHGKFRDQVRKINDRQLISKMSLVETNQVLAYARCTRG